MLTGHDLTPIWNAKVTFRDDGGIDSIEELGKEVHSQEVLIPGIFNAHVHSADIGLRGLKERSLEELVGDNGIKSRHLAGLTAEMLGKEVKRSYEEALEHKVSGWADFREGGIRGLEPYKELQDTFLAFGRPMVDEFERLETFDQFGIRDVAYYSPTLLEKLGRHAREYGKLIFLHASEDVHLREEWISKYGVSDVVWSVEIVKPDAIVHLTHSDREDFQIMKDNGIGAIFCLSSNQFTNVGIPNIPLAIESGLVFGVGTDNAMFSPLSVGDEIRRIRSNFPEIDPRTLVKMATVDGASLANLDFSVRVGSTLHTDLRLPTIDESNLFQKVVDAFP